MISFTLDIILDIVHTALILFILGGAFFKRTERWHFYIVMLVWASWIILGIYKGTLGYCPLTDWHWHIKRMQGETHLPPSFVEYVYTRITGQDVNNFLMQVIIFVSTLGVTVVSSIKYAKYRLS